MMKDQCFPNFRVILSPSALHAIPGYQAFQLASSNRVNLIIDPYVISQSRSLCIGTSLNRSCHLNLRHRDEAHKAT